MADNTTLNTGTGGDVIATDDIAGIKYQRVKIVLGVDGANDGDVHGGNPMPVSVDSGTVSISGTVAVTDNAGSLTVDGSVTANQPASTAYRVVVSDGTSDVPIDAAHADGETNTENHIDVGAKLLVFNGTTWDRQRGDATDGILVNLGTNNDVTVSGSVTVNDGLNIEGDVAHDSVDTGNPVKIGYKAHSSLGTPAATGDRVNAIADLYGRQMVTNIDDGMQVWKAANYTTTQTGTDIWTPSASKRIGITYLAISSYATTAARVILWFGASGDTTYNAGTDQLVWAGSFAPSSTSRPGAIISLPFGIHAVTADHRLKITTDAAISLDVTVYGYEH